MQETEHKWKLRKRRQKKIKITILTLAGICVIFGTTMALSAARQERETAQLFKGDSISIQEDAVATDLEADDTSSETSTSVDSEKDSPPSETIAGDSNAPKLSPKWVKEGMNGWQKHRNYWFYLNGEGQCLTGWIQVDTQWYYLDEKGRMQTGWLKDRDLWYYLTQDGVMTTGWQQIEGIWYYLRDKGEMAIGWIQPEGNSWYYLNEHGAMLTGWIQLAEGWYYLQSDGAMATGWIRDESGKNYYLQSNGLWIEGALPETANQNQTGDGAMVALTFDDGPGVHTERLLDSLEKYNARATFFMLGQLVSQFPDAVRRMDALGCEIGNHSFDHANLVHLQPESVQIEFGQTNEALIQIIGRGASVARPPYASMNKKVLSNIGMPSILWNIDTLDWETLNAQTTIDNVLNNVKDGDIILMHDIHKTSVDAAQYLIPALIDRGYALVTVTELAASRNIPLVPGETYGSF